MMADIMTTPIMVRTINCRVSALAAIINIVTLSTKMVMLGGREKA